MRSLNSFPHRSPGASARRQRRTSLLVVVALLALVWRSEFSAAQEFDSFAPPQLATSSERLMMEQVIELSRAEQYDEALTSLQKLYDQGAGSLVEVGGVQRASTQHGQRYIPLRQWCQARIGQLVAGHSSVRAQYLRQFDGLAAAALESLQTEKNSLEAKHVARRYRLTSSGADLQFLLVDLYLERGWSLAAIAAIERVAPELRYRAPIVEGAKGSALLDERASAPWWQLWARASDEDIRQRLMENWRAECNGGAAGPIEQPRLVEALERLLMAAALQPEAVDRQAVTSWIEAAASQFAAPQQEILLNALQQAQRWPAWPADGEWTTFADNPARAPRCVGSFDLSAWPDWNEQLERYTANSDRTSASKPRVGERDRGTLAYHPVIAGGRVYINELNRIRGFDLKSGRPWPDVAPALPLHDSGTSAAAYVPLGYPLVGAPRGTLAVAHDCLYARMGSPVTGWANQETAADGGSYSYLVGLDLTKQGSLLRGFPLRLTPPEFSGAEFEGCPVVWGEMLLAPIVERDNVGLRRSVVAFDRFSGELVWRSAVLAAGTVEGSDRANLITHQLLTVAGGRLFYNTNLGSIVCLDPTSGETEWLMRYSRHDQQKHVYPTPDRFRYRDMTPCLVSHGMVFCMPQDCAELFALDVSTGDLVWSSDDSEVADAIHLLGVSGHSLLVSGDRLIWIDRRNGKILDRFPGSGTPGLSNALPDPRGLGRGVITDGEVYWPTAGEVLVFDADISALSRENPPSINRRHQLDSRGSEGGNLSVAAGTMIYCGPSRLMAFQSSP